MENILASITMLDSMIVEFNIKNNEKISSEEKVNTKFQLGIGLPNEINIEQDTNNYEIGLKVNVIMEDEKTSQIITNIESEIKGIFAVCSKDKEQIINMLKYNGIPLLFQEIRAYITSVTSLSHNKTIILPMLNFFKFFENEEK